ncbi:substrate-binding domain-containing protein [Sphingobacterium sp. SGG-5]|nr:substrate-binding domain-containing protein [Sphingobacterium sp. SGG-5]
MKRELSFHPYIDFKFYDAEGSSSKQVSQIEEILKKKVDLLIVSPNESEPLSPIVDKAYRQGIPVIVVDRKTSTEHYNAYVGSDNFHIGRLAAQKIVDGIAKYNHQKTNIIYITGLTNSSASIEREKGLLDGLRTYKTQNPILRLQGNWLPESAEFALAKVDKQTLENTGFVFCFNDPMAYRASRYLDSLQLVQKPKVIGIDGLPGKGNGLDLVMNHILYATLHYPTGGKETIRTAVDILHNKDHKRNVDLGTMIIDSTNVQLLYDLENRLNGQYEDIDKQQVLLSELKNINKFEKYKSNLFLLLLIFSLVAILIILYILRNLKKSRSMIVENNKLIMLQNEELGLLNNKLNNNLKERTNLFKNLSYSLSNPISLLFSAIKDLQKKDDNHSMLRTRAVHVIQTISHRLNNVMMDIRNLEDLHNNIVIEKESTDLPALFNQIIYQLNSLIHEKNIKITVDNNLNSNKFVVSKKWMERALHNYMEYLLNISHPEGIIHFKLSHIIPDKGVKLKVTVGPFTSRELERARLEQDLQLGVGITFFQDVITQHQGKINYTFKDNFILFDIIFYEGSFSQNESLKTNDPKAEYKAELLEEDENCTFLSGRPNLLYIDNDHTWNTLLKRQFQNLYNVYTANSFDIARKKTEEYKFAVIITEIKIMSSSSHDFIKYLKNTSDHATALFILFTTHENKLQKEQAFKERYDLYLLKSEGLDILESAVTTLEKNRKQLVNKHLKLSEQDLSLIENAKMRTDHSIFVEKTNHIIDQNISNSQFNVSELAKALNISRVNLYNKFNEIFQMSPSDYILNIRLKKATHLLKSSLNISEVAYQSGFSSPSYFTKVFTAKFNHTPKSYQKIHTTS